MSTALPLVLGSFDGFTLDDATRDRLRRGMLGVTLFRETNVESQQQFADLTGEIHSLVHDGLPAIIAIDQEAGQLQTLADIVTDFPGNLAMSATGRTDLVERVGHAIGLELRAMGVTVNYAPVCDLLVHATNHGLSIRSFGDEPRRAAELTSALIAGMQRAGVAATAKHFPGKGGAEFDTHFSHAVIRRTREEFDEFELVPFVAAIDAGVRLAMTSHAAAPALTGEGEIPATRSRKVLTGLLRDELGFDGVCITDALDMAAVGEGDIATASESYQAVSAGADLLLMTAKMNHDALEAELLEAIGDDSDGVLADAVERSHALREWLAGFETPSADVVGCDEHRQIADEVARLSLTELAPGCAQPLPDGAAVIEIAQVNLTPADTTADNAATLAASLGAAGHRAVTLGVSHSPTPGEIEAAVAAASAAPETVVTVNAAATEPAQVELVRRVAAAAGRATLVVARNPLDASFLPTGDVDRTVFSYGLTESTARALAELLISGAEGHGTMPVAQLRDA